MLAIRRQCWKDGGRGEELRDKHRGQKGNKEVKGQLDGI